MGQDDDKHLNASLMGVSLDLAILHFTIPDSKLIE